VSERAAITLAFVLAIIGVPVMVVFDSPVTLAIGTLCLAGFIVFGAIGLLRPSRLGD
jgi:ABC-type sulfate transport system permease subunit